MWSCARLYRGTSFDHLELMLRNLYTLLSLRLQEKVHPVEVNYGVYGSHSDVLRHLSPASSHPLWSRFLDLLLSSLLHLTSSPITELEYASQALWPIYTSSLPPHLEQNQLNKLYPDPDKPPEPLMTSVKLLTDLKHNLAVPLAVAAEELLTRRTGISGFRERATRAIPGTPSRTPTRSADPGGLAGDMSLCTKFLVVAAYCASYNPAKTDLRLFGRMSSDGKRLRGGGMRRAGYGRTRIGKVSPILLALSCSGASS